MTRSLDRIIGEICSGAESLALTLKPNADWKPMLFLYGPDPDARADVFPLLGLDDAASKNHLVDVVIPRLVRQHGHPEGALAFVSTVWMLERRDTSREEAERVARAGIEDHPDRTEAVLVIACNPDEQRMTVARITRHRSRPPTLGAWASYPAAGTGRLRRLWRAFDPAP
jgi:hypothetical protein